jgi:hypothetical protein
MKRADVYIDLKGTEIPLTGLDREERALLSRLRRRARTRRSWTEFANYWTREVAALYDARGLTRAQSRQTPVYRVAQDLWSRLGIAAGLVRSPDYRVELEELIRQKYPSRRAFCEATGLSEDMLSHVLAGRKDLSLAKLTGALERIGHRLRIVPAPQPARSRKPRRTG